MTGPGAMIRARLPLWIGFAAIAAFVLTTVGWGTQAQLSGAVVAEGRLQAHTDPVPVQHETGGLTVEFPAPDGTKVQAGDLLLRLDGDDLQAELRLAEDRLARIAARRALFMAERDGALAPTELGADPGQGALFAARLATHQAALAGIDEMRRQLQAQIAGHNAEIDALTQQARLVAEERADKLDLARAGLVRVSETRGLDMKLAELNGATARLAAAIAEARAAQSGLDLDRTARIETRRQDAIAALQDLDLAQAELTRDMAQLRARLAALDLRAPIAGTVHGARIHAVGAVIRPAEPVLIIVPDPWPMRVLAQVRPEDGAKIHVGMTVYFRPRSRVPRGDTDLQGHVERISADLMQSGASGPSYYLVTIQPDAGAQEQLRLAAIPSGTPVTAFIATGSQTPLAYLTEPLTRYFHRALRED